MIRHAEEGDIPALLRLGKAFHDESGWNDIADYRPLDFAETLRKMIASEDAILLVCDVEETISGFAGALSFPLFFNFGHRTSQELFWYVLPEQRNGAGQALLCALESEAKKLGCGSLIMVALDKVRPEAVGRLYRGRGYRPAEHSWIRRL